MIEMIPNQPDNILGFTARGQVTGEDYESVLIPAVEARLKINPKIRLLYHLAEDFSGFDAGALWDDAKVGLGHLTAWEKIAFISDNQWLNGATKAFGLMMPCPVKVFEGHQLAEATEWLQV